MFQVPAEGAAAGHLVIRKEHTELKLDSKAQAIAQEDAIIFGTTGDGHKITCIDCVSLGTSTKLAGSATGKPTAFHQRRFFPHYVTIGSDHINVSTNCIREIRFSTTDLSSLFEDHHAFGIVTDAKDLIGSILKDRPQHADIPVGDWPQVAYFTGNMIVIELETALGQVCIRNHPRISMGGAEGASITNKVRLHLKPKFPIAFEAAVDHIATLARLLSVLAGRPQAVKGLRLFLSGKREPIDRGLKVYWSHSPKRGKPRYTRSAPHIADVPLDPIRRKEEFVVSVQRWLNLDEKRHQARLRHEGCTKKGGRYSYDRIVAAANMFDLLPKESYPASTEHLREKILARADVIHEALREGSLPNLSDAVHAAVSCRNHLVHGPKKSFDYGPIEPHLSFLTDCLEFIFEASDLIDCGWDAHSWHARHKGAGHRLASFIWSYDQQIAKLMQIEGIRR
ncbi:HEPN domain-containing protein [Luteimonas sp. TWI1437]|uniref:ApeA N-terminal domain 1-containing protein n=1 Tax=unclassified Luteimonas TaxID=2629088 RepID=UPI00320A465E